MKSLNYLSTIVLYLIFLTTNDVFSQAACTSANYGGATVIPANGYPYFSPGSGVTVTVLNIGRADSDPIIRKALAIGADDAVRIDADTTDALYVAKQIANYAKAEGYEMVLCGKETIDYNGSQVAGMVAELMGVPYVSLASKLEMNGNTATIERDIEGGIEVVECTTPFVLSAAKGMAEARIPNMRGIMAARTKPLNVVEAIEANNTTSIKGFSLPPAKSGCKYVDADNVEELVNLLHNEAKAI